MSFEGYYQRICTNGHPFTTDVYVDEECECGAPTLKSHMVDQTNGCSQNPDGSCLCGALEFVKCPDGTFDFGLPEKHDFRWTDAEMDCLDNDYNADWEAMCNCGGCDDHKELRHDGCPECNVFEHYRTCPTRG